MFIVQSRRKSPSGKIFILRYIKTRDVEGVTFISENHYLPLMKNRIFQRQLANKGKEEKNMTKRSRRKIKEYFNPMDTYCSQGCVIENNFVFVIVRGTKTPNQ